MKLSLNWLKDYVKLGVTKDDLSHKLTMAGFEVENIVEKNGDTLFELEITPNRADCLSVVGLARDISAILDKPLLEPNIKPIKFPANKISIMIQDVKDCPLYTGVLIENVSVKPTANGMKEKLASVGIRSINNLVDITNFCLLEYGQPLHVFDYDKLDGGVIHVRRAKKGEKIITIDDVERELDPTILVIADAKKPIAIAGIMGGKLMEVTSSTKNVLLESAYFDSTLTRRASRRLGLSSDSCYRFERGVDPSGVTKVSQRAVHLILESGGGKIIKYGKSGSTSLGKGNSITLSIEKVNSYLGTEISSPKVRKILKQLDFSITVNKNALKVTPPSSRKDVKSDVDIIEEIARIVGYDHLPETVPNIQASNIKTNSHWLIRNRMREHMLALGFNEAISFSLLNKNDLIKSKLPTEESVLITNPLSLDQEVLQPSKLPSLLNVVKTNINRNQKNLKLFELAKIYLSNGNEHETLNIIMTGFHPNDWRGRQKFPTDIYDLKGAVEQMFNFIGIKNVKYTVKEKEIFDRHKSLVVEYAGKEIGYLGELNDAILQNWGIKKENVLFAEISIPFQGVKDLSRRKYAEYSNFPAVTRDISMAVDHGISFETIKVLIKEVGGDLLKDVSFMELYLGEKVSAGMKGIIISLTYRANDKTLTENEVNSVHQKILNTLISQLKATIR
ncbi:MAG: phenylalanine--tRNA ligase subunit beta [Candidatus Omnitrophica bacterium]|nr:phenylalanine--tRNA ligase subunit beta [Candidatus Omnitrophota bacterium]